MGEKRKSLKVVVLGERNKWIGYYGLIRRRGGDVFTLTDEKHFSKKWMKWAPEDAEETTPKHFNEVGGGKLREVGPPVTADPEQAATTASAEPPSAAAPAGTPTGSRTVI